MARAAVDPRDDGLVDVKTKDAYSGFGDDGGKGQSNVAEADHSHGDIAGAEMLQHRIPRVLLHGLRPDSRTAQDGRTESENPVRLTRSAGSAAPS